MGGIAALTPSRQDATTEVGDRRFGARLSSAGEAAKASKRWGSLDASLRGERAAAEDSRAPKGVQGWEFPGASLCGERAAAGTAALRRVVSGRVSSFYADIR